MRCATHPEAETYLRCSKCERLICPDCMVSTPIGFRCRSCTNVRGLPRYNLRPPLMAQAVGASAGMILGAGIIWAMAFRTGFLMLLIIAGFGIGYLVAEAISRAAGRRTSSLLPVLGGVSAGMSLLAGNVMSYMFFTDLPLTFALRHMLDIGLWGMLSGVLSVGVAISRLRL